MTLWRHAESRKLEAAVMRRGRVARHEVFEDGATTLVQSVPPTVRHVWGGRVALAGTCVCLVTLLAMTIVLPRSELHAALGIPVFLAGMAICAIGVVVQTRETLESRLGDDGLGDWFPTMKIGAALFEVKEQVAATEAIAEPHDGYALVGVGADGATIELAALRRGRLDRYVLHDDGTTTQLASLPPTPAYRLGVGVAVLGVVLFLLSPFVGAVAPALDEDWARVGVGLSGFVLITIGSGLREKLPSRLAKAGEDPDAWLEYRTRAEDAGD